MLNLNANLSPETTELWFRGDISYKFHEGQDLIYSRIERLPKRKREVLILISRRWGKSFFGVCLAIQKCLSKPRAHVYIVGPTIRQTKEILVPIIADIMIDCPAGLIRETKSEYHWKVGYSFMHISGFDTAGESMRGKEADMVLLEESGQTRAENYEYTIRSIIRPTTMHTKGKIIHLTTPAKYEDHPLHTITMPKCELAGTLYKFDVYTNPLLTKADIDEEIEEMGGIDSPHTRRELFCEIVRDLSLVVIPEFNEYRHVGPVHLPPYAKWLTVLDFGGTQDMHGLLICFWDFKKAKLCVVEEFLLPNNTATNTIMDKGLELEKRVPKEHWVDVKSPSRRYAPRRIADCPGQIKIDLANLGFPVYTPEKKKGSWEAGQNEVRVALTNDQILISPKCKNLIATLRYGLFTDNRKDWKRTDKLGHLDMLAALMYAWRHVDRANPYPDMYKLSHQTHYVPDELQKNQKTLSDILL